MTIPTRAFAVASVIAMTVASLGPVSAFTCSSAQFQQIRSDEETYIYPACPSLYDVNGNAILMPGVIDKLTAGTFNAVARCGDPECVAVLKKAANIIPDCDMTDTTLSLPAWFGAMARLCDALAKGTVSTVGEARSFFDDEMTPSPVTNTPKPDTSTPRPIQSTPAPTPSTESPPPVVRTNESSSGSNSTFVGVGIGAGVVVVLLLVCLAVVCRRRRRTDKLDEPSARNDGFSYVDISQDGTVDTTFTQSNQFPEGRALEQYRIPLKTITLERVVSQGGFGEVWLGRYNKRVVAVKRLLAARRADRESIRGFVKEIQLTASLEHECLVKFIGVTWDVPANLSMITEFMKGGDLRMLLARYAKSDHANGHDDQKLRIALQVAHALTYLHSQNPPVVHRDLKSRNTLLSESMDAKVIDFGISCERQDVTMTAGVGTSLWMAPEVMVGERYNEKADVFSFGVMLSELDTHELPYDHARDPTSNRKMADMVVMQMITEGKLKPRFTEHANPQIVALARDCLEVDAAKRPTSMMVLHRLCTRLQDDPTLSVQTRAAVQNSSFVLDTRPSTRYHQRL